MPFRLDKEVRDLLLQQRRTGEPSLAFAFPLFADQRSKGRGKAKGSFTEKIRDEFAKWTRGNLITSSVPLTFDYKLSRHKVVTISGNCPYISHNPILGKGRKGFSLRLMILSINGIPYRGMRENSFAVSRIIGHDVLKLLGDSK